MAGAGKKTFTAGETLTASDVNTYLMEQSVMYFAGTAARSSAIPTPSTGMTSYIGVTGTATIPQIETYTGSAWQTPYGITQVANVSFTSASAVQINNVFSSNYDTYKVVFSNLSSSTGQTLSFQMSNGGTPVTTSTYGTQRLAVQTTSVVGVATATATSGALSVLGSNGLNFVSFEIMNPFLATITKTISTGNYSDTTTPFYIEMQTSRQSDATSFDGIRFLVAGTMSGTVRIYGYRNS